MTAPILPARGFPELPCLGCTVLNTCVVDLETMTIRCTSCEAEWAPADIQEVLERWHAVLDWIALAPPVG